MKKLIITEEERKVILSLHENEKSNNSNLVSEATVQDVQNKLIELGYKDMLGKTGADNKFGPNTAAAIMSALTSTSKVSQPSPSPTTPATGSAPAPATGSAPTPTSGSTPASTTPGGTPTADANKKEENTGIPSVNYKDEPFDSKTGF